MKILINKNNVVVDKSQTAEIVSNGTLINGVIYGEKGMQILDLNLDPEIDKTMIVNNQIVDNPNYQTPSEDETI